MCRRESKFSVLKTNFSWWRLRMKESDYPACHEADKEGKDTVLEGSNQLEMKQEASQELDCENNCLTGIKWPPESQPKNDGKKRTVLNGFRKIKAEIVTHGGRTSKLPARYLETDSENEGTLKQKRVRSRKDDIETSGERSSMCNSTSKRKICKNGRTESLKKKANQMEKRRRNSKPFCEVDLDVEAFENGDSNGDATESPKSLSNISTLPNTLKRNFFFSRSDTESSGGETPSKRGRTAKNSGHSTKKARGIKGSSKMNVSDSPHGDCCISATNASLTSPNLKPKKKKRKLLNGLRSANYQHGVSSDESSGEYSPKKRGRPPKHSYSNKNNERFSRDHSSKNGVRKPWVRPLIKSLHKRALYQSHEQHLQNCMSSSKQQLTKQQLTKAVSGNCTNGEVVKPKRGRPSRLDLLRRKELHSNDLYSFADDDDCVDPSKYNKQLKKMKKLKMSKKFGKRPLTATKVNKAEKLLANKLKKKAIKHKVAQNLSERRKDTLDSSDNTLNDSSESLQSSRRRNRNKIDRVLGMRLNTTGTYEYLVQWKDGTSCWTSPDQTADYELDLKEFLGHEYQEISSINRLVFKAYFNDNLDKVHTRLLMSEDEAPCTSDIDTMDDYHEDDDDDDDLFSDADDIFDNDSAITESPVATPKKRGRKPPEYEREYVCKEVSVQKLKDCIHITVSRSSGKQMRVNLRIIDSLTLALEEAAVDPSDTVVISGLGDDVFCGVDLETIVTVPLEGEVRNYRKDVDKIRYMIQTIQYYPKPIIATINKPAEGVGAQLIALCDMVCDKAALGDPVNLAVAKANGTIPYCFPRLMGHAAVSEQVLMGQPLSTPVTDWQNTLSEVFKTTKFTSELLSSVEAMSSIPSGQQTDCFGSDYGGACSSEIEQKLSREVEIEKSKVEESMKELMAFWEDVTSTMS